MKRDLRTFRVNHFGAPESESTPAHSEQHMGMDVVASEDARSGKRAIPTGPSDCENGDDLPQRVRMFLANSNIPALRFVRVQANGDAIVLSGTVRSYYEKQMAAQLSSRVAGVLRVIDLIIVRTYVPFQGRRNLYRQQSAPALYGN